MSEATIEKTSGNEETVGVVIPEGFKEDHKGRWIPVDMIKDIDLDRDQTVMAIVGYAEEISNIITGFRCDLLNEVVDFTGRSSEKYGHKWGGSKGNIQLLSYDGRYKVTVSIQERIEMTEEILVAKELLDKVAAEKSQGSDDFIKAVLARTFDMDGDGKINYRKVMDLRGIKCEDPRWLAGMEAIADCIKVVGSKQVVRIYKRSDEDGKYIPLKMDLR